MTAPLTDLKRFCGSKVNQINDLRKMHHTGNCWGRWLMSNRCMLRISAADSARTGRLLKDLC